jgi:hypothetical protein
MMIRRIFAAAALAALALFSIAPLQAAQINMCSADVAGGVQGPRTIGGSLSPVPSGAIYTLNGQGCALIQQADVGYFQSQGFTQASSEQTILFTTGVATGTTDFVIGTIPANAYVKSILVVNSTANAVTGNISVGTTANGTDVVASLACGANCVASSPGTTALAKAVFSATASTALHAAAITAWNNANVTFSIVLGYF